MLVRRLLVLLLLVNLAVAATPFDDLAPLAQLRALTALRESLERNPQDPQLLGQAAIHCTTLVGGANCWVMTATGPFLRRAEELLLRRRLVLPLERCLTLDQAAPELWYMVHSGRLSEAKALLARLPASDAPLQRAMRCFIDRDWRELSACTNRTPVEDYALLFAYSDCELADRVSALADSGTIPASVVWRANTELEAFSHQIPIAYLHQVMGEVVFLLASPTLDDATMRARAEPLAIALGVDPALAPRQRLLAALGRAVATMDPDHGQAVGAAWNMCEACLDAPAGLLDAAGRWQLFQLGDTAAWVRERLLAATWTRLHFTRFKLSAPEAAAQLQDGVTAAAPDSFLASYLLLRSLPGEATEPAITAMALAVEREFSRPNALSITLLARGLSFAVPQTSFPATLERARSLVVAALPTTPLPGLLQLLGCMEMLGMTDAVERLVTQARGWDPESFALHAPSFSDLMVPAVTAFPHQGSTLAMQVDYQRLPFPDLAETNYFSLRFSGVIRGVGDEELAVSSDDGSGLFLDQRLVVNNGGGHGDRLVSARVHLDDGWHDLRLDYYQGWRGGSCQLLCRPPGGTWVSVPAERLGHRVGTQVEPGLERQWWKLPVFQLNKVSHRTLLAQQRFATRPWRLTSRVDQAHFLSQAGQADAALAELRSLFAIEPGSYRIVFPLTEALERADQVDEALTVVESYARISQEFNVIHARLTLGRLYYQQGRVKQAEVAYETAAKSWQSNAMTDCAMFHLTCNRPERAIEWFARDAKRYKHAKSDLAVEIIRCYAGLASPLEFVERHPGQLSEVHKGQLTSFFIACCAASADPTIQALLDDPRVGWPEWSLGYRLLAQGRFDEAHDQLLRSAPTGTTHWSRTVLALAAALEPRPGGARHRLTALPAVETGRSRWLAPVLPGLLQDAWPESSGVQGDDRQGRVLQAIRRLAAGDRASAAALLAGVTLQPGDTANIVGLAGALRRLAANESAPAVVPVPPGDF